MDALGVDEAYLDVKPGADTEYFMYKLSADCHQCPYESMTTEPLTGGNSTVFTISTKRPWSFIFFNNNKTYLDPSKDIPPSNPNDNSTYHCSLENVWLGEFGVYQITASRNSCSIDVFKKPVFIYGGMIITAGVFLVVMLLVTVVPVLIHRIQHSGLATCCRIGDSQEDFNLSSTPGNASAVTAPAKIRVKSLDTFRGLSLVFMIFVNYSAGRYWFFEHSTWDGLLFADVLFPWFMWIMGVCIPMGVRSGLKRKVPKLKILFNIFKRSLKLFFLGIILNSLGGWITLSQYRIPGVLQRFAICYLVVASVMVVCPEPAKIQNKFGEVMSDVVSLSYQWIIYTLIVLVHTVLIFCVEVPGCPRGYLGPGGIALMNSDGDPTPDCIGGMTGYVDRWLLGVAHLYQNPTAKEVYHSGPFDPEGVLGSMLSIFQVFLGVVAGNVLHFHQDHKQRLARWAIWSILCGALGTILCFAGQEEAPIPVNKNLWSLSYVLVTSCFAFFLLALFYLLVDVLKVWSGSPFYQAGMNSILLYVGHSVTYNMFPWHYIIGPMRTHASLLAECLWGTALWVITAIYLHAKGKFYTV
ncbi:protein of unknown function DUF418 [Trinorchestia longiramus]|nr:protein of unknown function DUF418 [Trinorchestia longiramus]